MIYRIDVGTASRPREGVSGDAVGESIRQQIAEWGVKVGPISTRRIFLLDTEANEREVEAIARQLLADPRLVTDVGGVRRREAVLINEPRHQVDGGRFDGDGDSGYGI